jgi:hypothetical protein
MQCIESLWLSLEKLNKNSPPPPRRRRHKQIEMLQTLNMYNSDILKKHCTSSYCIKNLCCYYKPIKVIQIYIYIRTKQFKECITATILGMINTSNGTQALSTHTLLLCSYTTYVAVTVVLELRKNWSMF